MALLDPCGSLEVYQNPKKSQYIDGFIQIHQICVNKHKYENHIKFDVSLHFLPIWPTVRRTWGAAHRTPA